MDKRKWSQDMKDGLIAGLALLLFAVSCGYLLQYTAESPAQVTALTARATR